MKGKNVSCIKDPITNEEFYLKKINAREKEFYEHIDGYDIAPEFTVFKDDNNQEFIKMKAYNVGDVSNTLAYYIESNEIINIDHLDHISIPLHKKIKKLHDLGIVHVDLHTKNILVDLSKDTPNVYLIDFDMSRFIDDLCDEDFKDFKTFLPDFRVNKDYTLKQKIQYLMEYEYRMWQMDYF
jgi:tRNA A-37 threonylcarbamoyl transferase component Bud32